MNLYEAIYARRSVRAYRMEPLDDTILKGIPDFLDEVEPLFPDIRTEIRIVDRCTGKKKIGGLCNVKAPYYAVLYSEPKEKIFWYVDVKNDYSYKKLWRKQI